MAARSTLAKRAGDTVTTPATLNDVDAYMLRLQGIEQTITDAKADLASAIAKAKKDFRDKTRDLPKERENLKIRLRAWAKLNRHEIIARYGKTIRLSRDGVIRYRGPSGDIAICLPPPKIRAKIVDTIINIDLA